MSPPSPPCALSLIVTMLSQWQLLFTRLHALATALLLACVSLLWMPLAQAQASATTNPIAAGQGVLESATVNPDRSISLLGWAVSNRPDVFVTYARVWLGDTLIYEGRLGYATYRTDVAQSLGNPLWEISGFNLPMHVPDSVPAGEHRVRMEVMLGDQSRFEVQPLPGKDVIDLPAAPASPSMRAKALFWLALALPLLVWLISPWRSNTSNANQSHFGLGTEPARQDSPWLVTFALACLASFVLLVTGGWTGSSLPRLLNHTPLLEHNASVWLGQAQDVRSDEWQVVTPLAISQTYGPNPFPSINPLHGQPGQNMNVVGMTGTPIANAVAIAKPATWGFFFLDLRRALAWDWWLPFFACFGALLALLQRWFSPAWKLNAVLAASVAFSGYSVSWSGWPAYATFFPVAAVLAADCLLRAQRWLGALSASVLLGWASAGFVFVLYPGWQIPLGYLMGFLALAAAWQFRHAYHFRAPQIVGAVLACAIAALLLAAWWLDASDAIRTVSNTIYPGQRSLDLGGYADPWHMSKGLTNAVTLYSASQWSIASDAGNFIYVLAPLLMATVIAWAIQRRIDAISLVLWAFIAFVCCYLFWGLPAWLARPSLWSMVPAFRLDVALGLAQTFLLAWLLLQWQRIKAHAHSALNGTTTPAILLLNAAGALGAMYFVYSTAVQFSSMLAPLQAWLSPGLIGMIYAGCAALAYLLITGRIQAAILLYGGWTLATALPFNPLGQAPSSITTIAAVAQAIQPQPHGQVAVVGQKEWTNALTSAGVSVLNSTFYEPPLAFWAQLDPESTYADQYNRYQHLDINLSEDSSSLNPRHFSVGAPRMDRVELRLHPTQFDFNHLNVEFVVTNAAHAKALEHNPSLQRIAGEPQSWALFQVVPPRQHPEPADAITQTAQPLH